MDIRWYQTFDVGYIPNNAVPNVFMGVTLDLRDDPVDTITLTYTAVQAIEVRADVGFEVCCQGARYRDDLLWTPASISSHDALSVTITASSICAEQQLNGVRYLWQGTPCLFKQAAIYSSTDANLPSPPYYKRF